MKETWKPKVAGILVIVSGGFGLLTVFGLLIGAVITAIILSEGTENVPGFVPSLLVVLAVLFVISSVLSFVGGFYALRTKRWEWAITGSIAAFISSFPFLGGTPGIVAIILTVLSKEEFK